MSALHQLIRDALADTTTDLFLMEDEPPRIRRDGGVTQLHPGPIPRAAMEEFWKSCGVEPGETLEVDISWQIPDGGRLRVNLYHTLGRLAAVLRPIRKEIPALGDLALPAELLQGWMQRRQGLILVTGPTGSGKSTTVAACLDWINRHHSRHIVTLEDPIEFLFTNELSLFSQREIRQDAADFQTGLRSALRQSPDVLFIGEIRDRETAVTALHAAATGHLVISTLHSGSVVETLDRLCHLLGQENEGVLNLLASQLVGVISQQLLPRRGGGLFPGTGVFAKRGGHPPLDRGQAPHRAPGPPFESNRCQQLLAARIPRRLRPARLPRAGNRPRRLPAPAGFRSLDAGYFLINP